MTRKPDPMRISPVFEASGDKKGRPPENPCAPDNDAAARFEAALEKARNDSADRKSDHTPAPYKG